MEYFAKRLEEDPEVIGWWAWYIVLNLENKERVLIGSAGFSGYPSEDGTLLMGYSILDAYQRYGYATEAVKGLISWAFEHPNVMCITAETFPDHAASLRVMEKNNMEFIGEGSEPGLVKYGITRPQYQANVAN
jgi:RimJ/RimL family protein N-acetyltransferase